MPQFLAPLINAQQIDANGDPLTAGEIEIYLAGSSTAVASYSDKDGLIPNTWPLVLNTLGLNSQGAVWLPGGTAYKFVVKNEFGLVQRTIDNVTGINDTSITVDQWILFPGPPTYISPTSFSVVGDQTPTLQVGRRLKSINTGGTVYSTITASVYGAPNTTVTVDNTSGVLDAGLSQVSYGLLSALDSSLPVTGVGGFQAFASNGSFTAPASRIYYEIWGASGGGGGAGGGASCATGGAGSGYTSGVMVVTPGAALPVVVGVAGSGGSGGSGADGTAGTASTFNGKSAGGGMGGKGSVSGAASATGINPGSGSGGQLNLTGSGPLNAYQIGSVFVGSPGGAAPFGGGTTSISLGNGAPGIFPGGGGAGGASNGGAGAGGAGAGGLVILRW